MNKIFDKLTELRAAAAAARTASGADAAVDMQSLSGLVPFHPYNQRGHEHSFDAVFDVSAHSGGAAVDLKIEVSADEAFTTPVEVARVALGSDNKVGRHIAKVYLAEVFKLLATARWIRSAVTITGGTTPSIDFTSFLTKC